MAAATFFKTFKKIPKLKILFYFFLFLLLIMIISRLNLTTLNKKRGQCTEGFTIDELDENLSVENGPYAQAGGAGEDPDSNDGIIVKEASDVYDRFYANVYDELLFSKVKNDFEVGELINRTAPSKESIVLDVGSGTGHHVSSLIANGFRAIGIDKSNAMIQKAKKTYPNLDFRQADALVASTFSASTFTHITCFYFTIYYMQNKKQFFENCIYWLKPGGYLALHLVDREKFDPILPAGDPFKIISPQSYAKNRITSTVVKFDDFDYKSNFEVFPNDDTAVLGEVFKFKKSYDNSSGKKRMRRNEHKFYMPTQKKILNMAKEVGFIVLAEVDMVRCQYSGQYIYILQKPN
jgi:SAM-dependent methyltransferase